MASEKPPERSGHSSGPVVFEGSLLQQGTSHCEAVVMCCEFNMNGSLIGAGLSNGAIRVLKPGSTCSEVYKLNFSNSKRLPVTSVRFLGNSAPPKSGKEYVLLATYSSGFSALWHIASGQVLSSQKEEGQSLASAVSPGCETFCTSSSDGIIMLYDANAHNKIRTLEPSKSNSIMDGHVNRIFSARYHPADPNYLISAGWDDTIQFWDIRAPQSVRKIFGPHVCGDGLAIHPTNHTIVTGSWRQRDALQLWDFSSGKKIKSLQPDLNIKVYTVCWVGDNHLLVGGSQQNKAVLVDASRDWSTASMSGMESGVYDTDYSPAGKYVGVAAGNNLYLSTWKKRSSSQEILVR